MPPRVTRLEGAEPGAARELYNRSYRAGRVLEKDGKKAPGLDTSRPLAAKLRAWGERFTVAGVEEGIGGLGTHRVEGPRDPCVQGHRLQNTGKRPRPALPTVPEDPPSPPHSSAPPRQNTHSHRIIT